MALDSINHFLESHSLQVKFPAETSRAIEGENLIYLQMKVKIANFDCLIVFSLKKIGRAKKLKKFIGPILLGLGGKIFAVVPLFLVGLAFLAFKALVVSKLALLLAVIAAAGKLFGGVSSGGSGLGILGKVAGLSAGLGAGLGGAGLLGALGSSGAGANAGGYSGASQSAGGYSSAGNGGWSSGSGNSAYPYARSYDNAEDLAYNAHTQTE
jgi:hypothetical protein